MSEELKPVAKIMHLVDDYVVLRAAELLGRELGCTYRGPDSKEIRARIEATVSALQSRIAELEGRRTGWPPGMLQDDHRGLSKALAGKPDSAMHAREAAALARPLTAEDVRKAGGIVHSDGNVFFTNLDQLNAAIAAKEPRNG